MFNNPGAKIKGLATTFFWIEVVAVVIGILAMGDYLFEEIEGLIMAVGILVLGVGVAYIGALFLAAFGELGQTNTEISVTNKKILEEHRKHPGNGASN